LSWIFLKNDLNGYDLNHNKMNYILIILLILPLFVGAFEGQATFYQIQPRSEFGSCMLPKNFNNVTNTVAINAPQYEDGLVCGKCVLIHPKGTGIGMTPIVEPIFATIDNECPECHFGDIDIGMSGDGRWEIEWDFVPCH